MFKLTVRNSMIIRLFLILLIFAETQIAAQTGEVAPGVYTWNKLTAVKQDNTERRQLLKGTTSGLEYFEVYAVTFPKYENKLHDYSQMDAEQVILIKEGKLQVTLKNEQKTVGAGSAVVVMTGDKIKMRNAGDTPATCYIISLKTGKPLNTEQGFNEGGSFLVDFDTISFKPHDKGGIRNYFRKSSSMFEYIEMHVTTLNGNIKSHEPHTHKAAEIVLMISGNAEMQIGEKLYQGAAGDIFYLESNNPHALRNTSDEPCMYYAFQWE